MRRRGDEVSARQHHARAAVLEAELLAELPAGLSVKERSLFSLLAVSVVALRFKAEVSREVENIADTAARQ